MRSMEVARVAFERRGLQRAAEEAVLGVATIYVCVGGPSGNVNGEGDEKMLGLMEPPRPKLGRSTVFFSLKIRKNSMMEASLGTWMGEALGVFSSSPRLFVLFACRFAMDAAGLSLGAIFLYRVVRVYPAWNKACKNVLGCSWGNLLMARRSAVGAAHPGTIGFALCCALVSSLFAASHWVGGQEGAELAKWAATHGSALAWMLAHGVLTVAIYSLLPLLILIHALEDESSRLGVELQSLRGDPAAVARARCEEHALDQACGQGGKESAPSKAPRRL